MNLNLCAVLACTQDAWFLEPLPLCRPHALDISLNVTDLLHAHARTGGHGGSRDINSADIAPSSVWKTNAHPPVVYFLANGNRIKIGTSTNVTARVVTLALRRKNALLLLSGSNDLEKALHDHFEADRIGNTEWFHLSESIRDFIDRRTRAHAALSQPKLPDEPPAPGLNDVQPMHVPTSTAAGRILAALQKHDRPLHRDDLSRLTGVENSTLANTLSNLTKAGRVSRPADAPRGYYERVPEPAGPRKASAGAGG